MFDFARDAIEYAIKHGYPDSDRAIWWYEYDHHQLSSLRSKQILLSEEEVKKAMMIPCTTNCHTQIDGGPCSMECEINRGLAVAKAQLAKIKNK